MLNKTQLIEKLNFHFPSYGAKDGAEYGKDFKGAIWFCSETAAANFMANDTGEGDCPVSAFLDRHSWYVEHQDELTALAYKYIKPVDEWDSLVEKSKVEKLNEDEKQRLKFLQKHMLNTLHTGS